MVQLNKLTQNTAKRLHWKQLFDPGYKRICQHFEQHNQQFPAGKDQPYSYAHPFRLKDSEMKTAINAFRQWCQQTVDNIDKGAIYITNEVFTNNRSLRQTPDGGYGSKSVTPLHVGKLTYAKFFLGEEETEAEPHGATAFRHRDRGGRGFGWKPYKLFRGHQNDFKLLLSPDLLPTDIVQQVASFVPKTEGFNGKVIPLAPPTTTSPRMAQNSRHYSSSEIHVDKEISQKVSAGAESQSEDGSFSSAASAIADSRSEEGASEDGRPHKAGKLPPEKQGLSFEGADFSGAKIQNIPDSPHNNPSPPPSSHLPISRNPKLDLKTAFQLAHGDGRIEYYAKVLVEMYQDKLAMAMDRDYRSLQEKSYQNALKLLAQIDSADLESFHDRMVKVIDQQEKRLKSYPNRYVVGPVRFFDPEEKYGILHYEKNWLQVYESRAIEFEEMANARELRQKQLLQSEAEIASQKKEWYGLAWQFKLALMRLHKSDMRLRKANVSNWERDLRMMVRKEGAELNELTLILNWLMDSGLKNAQWWRSEYNIDGIKSTSSLRKNYQKIREAYHHDQAYAEKSAKTKSMIPENSQQPSKIPKATTGGNKQIPAKKRGPTQIPSARIKNFRR